MMASGIHWSIVAFCFRKISSRVGLTRKASAEVVAPTTSMQIIAIENLNACGFARFRSLLKMSKTGFLSLIRDRALFIPRGINRALSLIK